MRLVDYPYVIVRIGCSHCNRFGRYRLARLAARFGPEADVMDVARALAQPCDRLKPPEHNSAYPCGVCLPDLARGGPHNLPPAGPSRLRLVAGGRS